MFAFHSILDITNVLDFAGTQRHLLLYRLKTNSSTMHQAFPALIQDLRAQVWTWGMRLF